MNWQNVAAVAVVVWVLWSMRPVWVEVGKGVGRFWKDAWPMFAFFGAMVACGAATWCACRCVDHTIDWFSGVNSAVRRVEAVEQRAEQNIICEVLMRRSVDNNLSDRLDALERKVAEHGKRQNPWWPPLTNGIEKARTP